MFGVKIEPGEGEDAPEPQRRSALEKRGPKLPRDSEMKEPGSGNLDAEASGAAAAGAEAPGARGWPGSPKRPGKAPPSRAAETQRSHPDSAELENVSLRN